MKRLELTRLVSDSDTTIGVITFQNKFAGFTCEDEFRWDKKPGETRIPAGTYQLQLRTGSPMADKYQRRYGAWHSGMIWLQDVPNFTYVYIHTGNTDDHTEGCILVGYGAAARPGDQMTISQSRAAYAQLANQLIPAIESGESCTLQIIDKDMT